MYFHPCGTAQGWLRFHLRHVTKSYCLQVRLEDKEDETNLGAACTLQYKVNERSYTIYGHYYETIATRK